MRISDWSSDVCSSDLNPIEGRVGWAVGWKKDAFWGRDVLLAAKEKGVERLLRGLVAVGRGIPRLGMSVSLTSHVLLCEITSGKIGRAACRERVCQYV